MKNIIQRTITGALFIAVVVAGVCIHPLLFAVIFSMVAGFLIHEFYILSKYEGALWQCCLGITGGMYLLVSSCLFAGDYVSYLIFLPYIFILMVLLVSELFSKSSNPVMQWGLICFSQFYCAGFLALLSFIPYMQSTKYNPLPVLMIFIFIWLNDTGAYLVGTWVGKRRMFRRISPLKSWEGFWGGLVVILIASMVCAHFYTDLKWYYWLVFGIITVISATWGDLLESLLKRTFGVKDSGTILPGHGGMLDRFDSALLVSPAMYIYFELIIRN